MVVVHWAWAYIECRFANTRSAPVKTYGDVIRQHRDEHASDWVTGALQMALATNEIQPVLQRFLRLPA